MTKPATPTPKVEFDKPGWALLLEWLSKLQKAATSGPFGTTPPTSVELDAYSRIVFTASMNQD